jgi:hypothetical protein
MSDLWKLERDFFDRGGFLAHMSTGLAGVALTSLLSDAGLLATAAAHQNSLHPSIDPRRPHTPRPSHHPPQAHRVLMTFCSGAISQIDTFDYKPELVKRDGQALPGADKIKNFFGPPGVLAKPYYAFRPRGRVGKMTSDLLPDLGDLVDDFCFIHSLKAKTNNHAPAENFLSTGFTRAGFPSMGAWVNYALGSDNENLPAFVAIPDPRGLPQSTGNNWGRGFCRLCSKVLRWARHGQFAIWSVPIRSASTPMSRRVSCSSCLIGDIANVTPAIAIWNRESPVTSWRRKCN